MNKKQVSQIVERVLAEINTPAPKKALAQPSLFPEVPTAKKDPRGAVVYLNSKTQSKTSKRVFVIPNDRTKRNGKHGISCNLATEAGTRKFMEALWGCYS